MKRLVIFCPYPTQQAPSQRFRFEQYLPLLEENNFKITLLPLFSQSVWDVLYEKGLAKKAWYTTMAAIGQFFRISDSFRADFILIHREIIPFGPPIIEWFLAKALRKKIIYDFDDAIWLTDKANERWFEKRLRWRSKIGLICKWSYKVSCGNEYLCSYARQYNTNIVLNPTTIDMVHNRDLHPDILSSLKKGQTILTIGWTGSHSTLKYLEKLGFVLKRIIERFPFVSLLVIADRPRKLELENVVFKRWTSETEIEDLSRIDIGIMPMPDDKWTRGKCGLKALQYMALGIPSLVSPVAVNKSIITPGVNGFWCDSEQEWMDCLTRLIEDPQLRKTIGTKGRETVEQRYSVSSNTENFLALFE